MDDLFASKSPIYLQIKHALTEKICAGEFRPGDQLPPVRELALHFGVNPNTMQRALAELDRDGLTGTERTAGRFVTDDAARIGAAKKALVEELVQTFYDGCANLGLSREEALKYLDSKGGSL